MNEAICSVSECSAIATKYVTAKLHLLYTVDMEVCNTHYEEWLDIPIHNVGKFTRVD